MATRRNLCTNPALSVDATGWGGGAAPTRTAVTGFVRPWAAEYASGTFASSAATSTGAVTVGATYTVSAYARSNTFQVNSGSIYIEWINGSGTGFGYPAASWSAPFNTVTRISVTAVAPEGAVAARVIIDGINFPISPGDFTAVLIEEAGTLDAYFDGDSAGASWDGTAGLSSSTLTDTSASAVTAYGGFTLAGAAGARKAAPIIGRAAVSIAGASATRKVAPMIGVTGAVLAGSGVVRKVTVAAGAPYVLLSGRHAQAISRAVAGISSLAAVGRGVAAKVSRVADLAPLAIAGSASARHVAAPSSVGGVALTGAAANGHRATSASSAGFLLAGAGAPRRVAGAAGRGVLLLAARMDLTVGLAPARLTSGSRPLASFRGGVE
ncbi:hypothetical protein ABT340_35830 [Streptosporangium sp. NPDC000239]|uniref:hypothetical protein n=1 Tax=Streptosporangium sp. NPDC000239 TaxID=3154248 RepID=UPI00331BF904